MRVIYDAGLIGLALSILVPWFVMRRAGVGLALTAALTAISLANGASVSGINNPYVALPILVAILTAHTVTQPGERELAPATHARKRRTRGLASAR